jgi:NitT/TauT family transport system ATP-binding protein
MKQRVALAQAFILKPKVVLLDEPFGALDEAMREELQFMLLRFYQENLEMKHAGKRPQYTILIVTHELNEAIFVADRVIGMSRFHTEGDRGATIVYDKPCPVFHPDDPRDYSKFVEQREELRRAVFDDEYIKDRNKYVTFTSDLGKLAEGQSMAPAPKPTAVNSQQL